MRGEMNLQGGEICVKEMTSPTVGRMRNSSFAIALEKRGYECSRRYEAKVSPLLHIQPRVCIRKTCPKRIDSKIYFCLGGWVGLSDERVRRVSGLALHKRFWRYLPRETNPDRPSVSNPHAAVRPSASVLIGPIDCVTTWDRRQTNTKWISIGRPLPDGSSADASLVGLRRPHVR